MHHPDDELRQAAAHLHGARFAEAAELAADALEHFPDCGPLWVIRALAERRLGNFDQARRAFEQAALLVPLDGDALCQLADCYVRSGRANMARTVLETLAEEPDCPTSLLPQLAAGFAQLGDFERALSMCRTAAERQPHDAAPHFGAAYYLKRLGYPAALVVPWANRAFELDPQMPVYRTTLALLLAEAGRNEEAYDLLRDVPLSACGCPCRVRQMMALFRAVGDHARFCKCSQHLRSLRGPAD